MKRIVLLCTAVVLAVTLVWLVGCTKDDNTTVAPTPRDQSRIGTGPANPTGVTGGSGPTGTKSTNAGTTLSEAFVPPTANCYNYYQWSCAKSMDKQSLSICRNACDVATATVSVTKGAQVSGFSGTLCVTNGGDIATVGLKVGVSLNSKADGPGQFAPTGYTQIGLESQHPTLAAGETFCYSYTISCPINPSLNYIVVTDGYVTITNHSGPDCIGAGNACGPNGKTLSAHGCPPSNSCIDVSDTPGALLDALGVTDATSWTVTASTTDNTHLCASGDVHYSITVCNVNAPDEETWTGSNTANVGSGDGSSTCSAGFSLSTVGCRQNNGCTLTQGYWKTHGCVGPHGSSQYGNNPDKISPLLAGGPVSLGAKTVATCEDAGGVFQGAEHNGGNAILRLYSQLLAADLNILSGADGAAVAAAIADANAVLSAADANGDGSGWSTISGANRSRVINDAGALDAYNTGTTGPGHCE